MRLGALAVVVFAVARQHSTWYVLGVYILSFHPSQRRYGNQPTR